MKKAFVLGAAVLAAALVASSIDAALTAAKPPKRWRGTAQYAYTLKDAERTVDNTMSASVLLVPVHGRTNTYEISSGTVKWAYTEKSTADGCTLKASGSYRATKYHLTLQVVGTSASPRATFSGSEGGSSAPVQGTRTCPDGSSVDSPLAVFNPFFMLTRHTAGFRVKGSPSKIAGSLRTAQSGGVWTLRFSFAGQR